MQMRIRFQSAVIKFHLNFCYILSSLKDKKKKPAHLNCKEFILCISSALAVEEILK